MAGAHAFLPPSGQWALCPMWAAMNAAYPDAGGTAADEGTAAHWVFAEMKAGRAPSIGTPTPAGPVVDHDMLVGAALMCSELPGDGWAVERTVVNAAIHKHCWGTPDAARYSPGRLKLVDYKYGYGLVEVYRNWQLLAYSALLLEEAGVNGLSDQSTIVEMVVVQPRAHHREGPVRRWEVRASDLRGPFNMLRNAAEQACSAEPPAHTGGHCTYCPGRHACETLQRSSYAAVDLSGRGLPLELPDAAMGRELATLRVASERLGARITGLEAQIEQRLRNGASVPGWTLERGRSNERWKIPPEALMAMAQTLGVNVSKPGVLTPNQAREAGLPDAVVAAVSERPPAPLKLARADATAAAKVFGK
jgi:hypothetical protein